MYGILTLFVFESNYKSIVFHITPLNSAIERGNIEIINLLLNHPEIDINYKSISIIFLNHISNNLFIFIMFSKAYF